MPICPKCNSESGDNWTQCEGGPCPMSMSPYYQEPFGTYQGRPVFDQERWRVLTARAHLDSNGLRVTTLPRIYVVHPVREDLSDALRFGPLLRYINDRYVYADETGDQNELPEPAQSKLVEAADDFKPDLDFFLLVGDHLQTTTFAALLGARYSQFRVLRYDRQMPAYIPILIKVPRDDDPFHG